MVSLSRLLWNFLFLTEALHLQLPAYRPRHDHHPEYQIYTPLPRHLDHLPFLELSRIRIRRRCCLDYLWRYPLKTASVERRKQTRQDVANPSRCLNIDSCRSCHCQPWHILPCHRLQYQPRSHTDLFQL